ncbi:type IV pilus biogenesis protein PilM [Ornithinibacillus halophilus]|uniref:Type IV pilus assembly protein PilM n=1 Tax=Ornithinibacillus halophilus TaxID=930117 RepID=A0A1M5EHS2_9BACI|nr:pilus assembly protein PilM [Ornithinibacillus halophilus]SHF78706.1 type IV pilus assembly protein PilM [Ornithinibacillus halophilus]
MGLFGNGRVNIVITNRVLRYSFHKNPSVDGMVSHGEVKLPEGIMKDGIITNKAVFEEIIHKLVKENKWRRKKVSFSVPDDTVVIRQLKVPASLTKNEAMGYIKTQIGNSVYLPFANPAIALDFLDTIEEENRNVLLYAYPKEKIATLEDVFENKGLEPVVADLTTLSVYRYYYQNKQADKQHVLLIHWNKDALVLSAFQHDKAIFTRHMKTTTVEENSEITKETAHQIIDEYMIEVNRIIDFYQYSITKGQHQIELLILSGDFPYLNAVRKNLQETSSIPIHEFPEDKVPVKYADVLGLALKTET